MGGLRSTRPARLAVNEESGLKSRLHMGPRSQAKYGKWWQEHAGRARRITTPIRRSSNAGAPEPGTRKWRAFSWERPFQSSGLRGTMKKRSMSYSSGSTLSHSIRQWPQEINSLWPGKSWDESIRTVTHIGVRSTGVSDSRIQQTLYGLGSALQSGCSPPRILP